ncbi:hypothetical protein DRW03_03650 [Corallococcus sp. H22C18031201]|nr:hypothetical protein DRW03_03650 [Corallococcus sp. H22C18031201]
MFPSQEVTVVVAPALRGAFDGRRELRLGVPVPSSVGDVVETLLKLYPSARKLLLSERASGPAVYLHLALDAGAGEAWGHEVSEPAPGRTLYVFALSRPSPGGRAGVDG